MADQDPALENPSEQPEEGKKNSLLSTLKEKAKETVQKLVTKSKKGSDEGSADRSEGKSTGEEQTNDNSEDSSSEAQRESKVGEEPTGTAEGKEAQNISGHGLSFDGLTDKSGNDKLSPFARASAEKDPLTASPLIATPTSYGEPHTTVEDVMPPLVIEPISASELGEESSSNLGNIPEAKDEEKAAAKEVEEGGPDSDISEGFKDTFHQKDLQAIDGLPKPRGFDVGNESVVRSGDLGFHKYPSMTSSREAEGDVEGPKGGEREFSVDGTNDGTVQSRGIEQSDNEKPHPPGSVADFKDSMFSSNAVHDLKANDPNVQEAQHAGETGTLSRVFDPEASKSRDTEGDTPHPAGSVAELKDSMFSSNAVHDLKPNEPEAQEAKKAGEIGTFSRDFEPEAKQSSGTEGDGGIFQDPPAERTGDLSREDEFEGNTNFHDAPKELPPPALAGERMEDRQKFDGSSAGMGGSSDHDNKSITAEEEAENYFDALSDEAVLVSQRSLDSDAGKDFNPEVTAEYEEQRDALKASAESRIEAAVNDEKASKETGADSYVTGILPH